MCTVFSQIEDAGKVWYKLCADHSDLLKGLCFEHFLIQLRALEDYSVFNDEERYRLEKVSNYFDLDRAISSALRREAPSVLRALHGALVNSIGKPGVTRHSEIADTMLAG